MGAHGHLLHRRAAGRGGCRQPSREGELERLTAQQRDGLEALRDAAERTGRRRTSSPDYPGNRPIVTESEWEAEFYRRAFSDSDSQDTKRKAFKRVRDVLREKRVVGAYNGYFWTVQP